MVTKEIRKIRCNDALRVLVEHNEAVFFTLTTPDEVDFCTIRARWRSLRHDLLRALRKRSAGRKIHYVMNYELHPGYLQKIVRDPRTVDRVIRSTGRSHGWHIHGVLSCFLPLDQFLPMLRRNGFGRVDVRRVKTKGVSDYLTKHALKAYAGLSKKERELYQGSRRRLVNTSRGLPALNEYAYQSAHLDAVRNLMKEEKQNINDLQKQVDADITISPYVAGSHRLLYDYRRLRCRAECCALLGLVRTFDLVKVIERLQHGGGIASLVSRLQWRGVFEQAGVTTVKADVQNSERERAARDSVFDGAGYGVRDFAIGRRRRASGD